MITVAEVIKQLQQYPPETSVVQSTDPEGNSFSPVLCIENVEYLPETEFRGDLWDSYDQTAKRPKEVMPAVCFWPSS